MGKFEHGFGTQLGAVLLWRRVPSASLMLAVWYACSLVKLQETEKETTAAGDKKRDIFSENSEGALGSFCG